jgi:hypothetical protein
VGTIGWISVVLGALGIAGNLCGVAGPLLAKPIHAWMRSMMAQAPQAQIDQFDAQMAAQNKYMPWMVTLAGLSLFVSVVLLVAGIKLLKQWPEAVTWLRGWAVARLIFGMAGMILGFLTNAATAEATSAQGGPAAMGGAMGEILGLIGLVVTGLWAAAWPVFVLIWFARPKIREEVRTWAAVPLEP